jgi:c-di-GMP-binding flagellar brake protein YcgR
MIGTNWQTGAEGVQGKKALEQEWLRYEGVERRDTYRFNMTKGHPVKLIMIINDLIIKKGVIRDLSAGGFACDFYEFNNLPLRQKTNVRFKLDMEDPVIIKSETIFQGVKDIDKRINRFEFSNSMSEGERDSIHQFILIKQLEVFRRNRRKIQDD